MKWSDEEKTAAFEMRKQRMTCRVIGERLGRHPRAVAGLFERNSVRKTVQPSGCYAGPPIARCKEAEKMRDDAVKGSTALVNRILELSK